MTYTPIDELGSTPVNANFSFTSTFILENTIVLIETIKNCTVLYNNIYLNHNILPSSVIFTGNVSLDVFDQYQLTYIDKGRSDKNQTPVVSSIGNMPDHKELYKIQPDSRVSIQIPITITLEIEKKTLGLTPEEDTIEIINQVINYNLEVLNDLNFISIWVKDYYENRY